MTGSLATTDDVKTRRNRRGNWTVRGGGVDRAEVSQISGDLVLLRSQVGLRPVADGKLTDTEYASHLERPREQLFIGLFSWRLNKPRFPLGNKA